MQRTNIAENYRYFIGPKGLKRIARNRDDVHTETGNFKDNIEPVLPLRQVKNIKNGIVVVFHCAKNLEAKQKEMLYIAQALAGESAVLAVCFGNVEDNHLQQGADRVIIMKSASWQQYQPQAKLQLLKQLKQKFEPKHFIFTDDNEGQDLSRRFAVAMELSFAENVAEINKDNIIRYTQSCTKQQQISLPDILCLGAGLSRGSFEYVCEAKPYEITAEIDFDQRQANTQEEMQNISLEQADFICSAGNGIADVETFNKFSNTLGAAIGASRIMVDEKKFKKEQQIGATGVSVQSNVYIALGISGAIQHLQGIEQCNKVIAVNTDANCAMTKRANFSIIHDAQEFMKATINLLQQKNKNE